MVKTEPRGVDATGFWACVSDQDKIFYHKEPIRSSEFVNRKIWKLSEKYDIDLLLGHCRATSYGIGSEYINSNNHPHVSEDHRIALIHNGAIPEYKYLKSIYSVETDCDSEILLRLFESGEKFREQKEYLKEQLGNVNSEFTDLYRILGLKKIFSEAYYGQMAVAIGELLENERSLWLFHNEHRPVCFIDLRETLGQIFFCSTKEIFRAAVDDTKEARKLIPEHQIVITPPDNYIYHFILKNKEIKWETILANKCLSVKKPDSTLPTGQKIKRKPVEVITCMDDNCEVLKPANKEDSLLAIDADAIVDLCAEAISVLNTISTCVQNDIKEGNLTETDVEFLIDNLVEVVKTLEGLSYD